MGENFVPVNRGDNADTACGKFQIFPMYNLRNTQGSFFQPFCNIKPVSCGGKIEYHFYPLFS